MLEEDVLLRDEATTMIPIYSDEGGVTATVTSFACINRNAKHAEEAFFILDLLMSREVQQEARQYKLYNLIGDLNLSIPMHMDLMQEEYPIDRSRVPGICRLKILTHLVQCGTRSRRFVSAGDWKPSCMSWKLRG